MRKGTVTADNFLSFFSLPFLVFNICTRKRLFGSLGKSIALFDIQFLKFGTSCRKGIGKKWCKSWQFSPSLPVHQDGGLKAKHAQHKIDLWAELPGCSVKVQRFRSIVTISCSQLWHSVDAYARGSLIHWAEVYCSLRHCNWCHTLWMATSQLRHLYCNSFTWKCCDLCWDRLPGEKATTQLLLSERPYIRWS